MMRNQPDMTFQRSPELDQRLDELPEEPTASDYRKAATGLLPILAEVPALGSGQSWRRLQFMMRIARRDLGLARLLEGHLDALQILSEHHREPETQHLYGIWASGGPNDSLALNTAPTEDDRRSETRLLLNGSKPFCSGADLVDRALIYVYPSEQLIEVPVRNAAASGRATFDPGQWKTAAFSETHTWTLRFDSQPIHPDDFIGEPHWYFRRPGFAHGAIGPAACWLGGALGLMAVLQKEVLKNAHAEAHYGAMISTCVAMQASLKWAAEGIDADPENRRGESFIRALAVRHQIEQGCSDIMTRFGRTLGPRPYAFDTQTARRIAELTLYVRQSHAEKDLAELGASVEQSQHHLWDWTR